MVGDAAEVEAWMAKAACKGSNVHEFFPMGRGSTSTIDTCNVCAVRDECLDYVLSFGANQPGVWGGTTEQDRKRARGVGR